MNWPTKQRIAEWYIKALFFVMVGAVLWGLGVILVDGIGLAGVGLTAVAVVTVWALIHLD